MSKSKRSIRSGVRNPIARAVGSISAVLIVVSGATFAALQSQSSVMEGSRIISATANLQIGDRDGNFSNRRAGYDFDGIVPGGPAFPYDGATFNLWNLGTTDLKLRANLNPDKFYQAGSTNLSRVFLVIRDLDNSQTHEVTIGELLNAAYEQEPLDLGITIPSGYNQAFTLQARIASDAVSSTQEQVVLQNIDLIFKGEMVSET